MKFLLTLLLTTAVAGAQTNYPPASVPFDDNPTNWVYDCSFLGYLNMNPDSSPLPCGWYDEPVLTNSVVGGFAPLSSFALALSIVALTNYPQITVGRLVTRAHVTLTFQVVNCSVGGKYTILAAEYLTNSFVNQLNTFIASDFTNYYTVTEDWSDSGFFEVTGPALTSDETNELIVSNYVGQLDALASDPSIQGGFNAGLFFGATVVSCLFGFSIVRSVVSDGHEEL